MPQKPLGFQQITGIQSNVTVALTIPASTIWASVQAEAQNVRWRDDGTDPTATVGVEEILAASGSNNIITFTASQLKKLRFIGAANGAIINISYYKVVFLIVWLSMMVQVVC